MNALILIVINWEPKNHYAVYVKNFIVINTITLKIKMNYIKFILHVIIILKFCNLCENLLWY